MENSCIDFIFEFTFANLKKNNLFVYGKMGLFRKNRELQFGTGKLKSIIGNFEGTKGSQLLLGFRRKLGRSVLNKSSLEKNKSLRL